MNLNHNPFWPRNAFRFGGGGSTAAQAIQQAPAPAVAPPVTSTNSEVVQAQNDLRRQSLRKRGFSKTVFAGDSGGYKPQTAGAASPTNPQAVPSVGGTGGATKLGG